MSLIKDVTSDGQVLATQATLENIETSAAQIPSDPAREGGNLATAVTALTSIDTKTPALVGGALPVSGTVTIDAFTASTAPLPTGAATETTLATLATEATVAALASEATLAGIDGKLPSAGVASELTLSSIDGKLPALVGGEVPVAVGNSVTVTGPLTDTQLRATALPVSAASLPLPTGAASETTLASVDGKLPALSGGRVPVDGSGVTQPVSIAATVTVSGTVTANAGTGTLAVSGPLTDAELRASAVPVADGGGSLTVDAASWPLPTGAATEATLATLESIVDTNNSSTTALLASASFIGAWTDAGRYSEVVVRSCSNVAGAATAVYIYATAHPTAGSEVILATGANPGAGFGLVVRASIASTPYRYIQVKYTNGGSNQTTFDIQTILYRGAGRLEVMGTQPTGSAASSAGPPVLVSGSDGSTVRTVVTDTSGRQIVVGAAGNGATISAAGNPIIVGGSDGFNGRYLSVDTSGRPQVDLVRVGSSTLTLGQKIAASSIPVVLASDTALPAGTNAIGKLAANSGVDIGDVDVLSLPSLPAGTNAIGKLAANSGVDIGDVDVLSLPSLPAGTNDIGVVSLATDTRTVLNYYAVGAAAGATGTETAITLTESSGTSATSTGTSFTPTNGKRFRITAAIFATRGNATATAQVTTFSLRINTGGAVTTTSTPITIRVRSATPATASAWDRVELPIPDGYEITGNGTLQWGITANAVYTTNAPTWDVWLTGYEYAP